MNRSRSRHGDTSREMKDFDPNERFDRLERMVAALHPKMNSLLRASNLEIDLELEQMANFAELAEKVTKIKGTVDSGKAVLRDLRIKIEELAAASNDEADQAAIAALAVELGAAETALAEAIATPGTGGSVGGVSGSTGGI